MSLNGDRMAFLIHFIIMIIFIIIGFGGLFVFFFYVFLSTIPRLSLSRLE